MSTFKFLNTPRESSDSRFDTVKERDCSFCLIIVLLLFNCSLITPGGRTYGIGVLLLFSSIFTVFTSKVVPSSEGSLSTSGSCSVFVYVRQSPLTKSKVAKRRTVGLLKPVIYIRIKLIDLKSVIPPTASVKSLNGILYWIQR